MDMAKQGQKLTDELKEQIRAHLVLSDNKNEIAKKLKVSWASVDKIAKEIEEFPEEEEKFENLREQKKLQMIDKLWENMTDALELGHDIVKKAKKGDVDVPLSHISTYYGTLYDKHALMTGGKTADVGLSFEDQLRGLIQK
jgi:predicted DNA-binding protein YlxM (UPF0122 family)